MVDIAHHIDVCVRVSIVGVQTTRRFVWHLFVVRLVAFSRSGSSMIRSHSDCLKVKSV